MKNYIKHYDIVIYTDGACRGNPGNGSWSYCITYGSRGLVEARSEYVGETSNNRVELLAVVTVLQKLLKQKIENQSILLLSDSRYVVDNSHKLLKWNRKGMEKLQNGDLWQKFVRIVGELLVKNNSISTKWVKSHSKDKYNMMVDLLANMSLDSLGDKHETLQR